MVAAFDALRAETDRKVEQATGKARATVLRMRALAWWRVVMAYYPGGVVPVDTAACMMRVSRSTVERWIRSGRLPKVEGFIGPRGHKALFVPVDYLLAAPTVSDRGRPFVASGVYGAGGPEGPRRWGPVTAHGVDGLESAQSVVFGEKSSGPIRVRNGIVPNVPKLLD